MNLDFCSGDLGRSKIEVTAIARQVVSVNPPIVKHPRVSWKIDGTCPLAQTPNVASPELGAPLHCALFRTAGRQRLRGAPRGPLRGVGCWTRARGLMKERRSAILPHLVSQMNAQRLAWHAANQRAKVRSTG